MSRHLMYRWIPTCAAVLLVVELIGCGKNETSTPAAEATPAKAPDAAPAPAASAAPGALAADAAVPAAPAPGPIRTTPAPGAADPLIAATPTAPGVVGATPAELADTIKSTIALLQAGKTAEVIEKIAPPSAVSERKGRGDFDQMVARFETRIPALIAALQEAQNQMPVLSENNTRAEFPKPTDGPALRFQIIDGAWRLR